MTVYFRGPYFVEIFSHSIYAPHVQTISTLDWSPGLTYGEFVTHAGGTIQADDMVEQLVDLQAEFFPATYAWDNFVIYHQPTPSDPAIPQVGKVLTQIGLNGAPGNSKAVQGTYTFKTVAGNLFKLVLMDVGNGNSFEKITPSTLSGDGLALVAELEDLSNGWVGRDGSRPSYFLQASFTLNEKLRRQYHMD